VKFRSSLVWKMALLLGAAVLAWPAAANTHRVDDFVLLDHTGKALQLYYQSDASAIVLMVQGNGCQVVRSTLADYKALRDDYAARGVRVYMINSNLQDTREAIALEAAEWGIDMPILHDSAQIIGQSLNLTRTGEVLVIDPRSWNIVYRGALNNRVDYERQKYEASAHYVRDVLNALIAGEEVAFSEIKSPGCIINFSQADQEHPISYSETIAPLLKENCVACHIEGEDPLASITAVESKWTLCEPDLILEVPAFDVPATGIVDYQFPVIANPLDRDVWVVAATIIPGNTQVVHHVLLGSADEPPTESGRESVFQNYIMGYAPGNESSHMPEGTGVFVPAGGVYQLQLHYTPIGKAVTDRTRVGLYFADQPPANFLRNHVIVDPTIKIAPNTEEHEETAYFEFWDDAIIHSLVPHSHYRGRASDFTLVYPDGTTEVILSVPNYDFNWQRTYAFAEPKQVPRGTKLIHRTVYDNSVKNPGNPDPDRTVPWGLQSHDEMLYGSVAFSWVHETSAQPTHTRLKSEAAQWLGFMDKDMDGKAGKDEMPQKLRKSIGWKWWFVDKNHDGGLDQAELEKLMSKWVKG